MQVSVIGSLAKYVVIANAVAITNTNLQFFDLKTSGLTEEEIRQYRDFKISIINSHDQAASVQLRSEMKALGAPSTAGTIYKETGNLIATTGRMTLGAKAGGTGVDSTYKAVPNLNGVHSNIIVGVQFTVAPISGSITIGVEMNA